jgi:hypothetical protein
VTPIPIQDTDIRDHARALSSPVALAFVRIVMTRRGLSEVQASQLYIEYINRAQPERERSRR